MNRNDLSHTVLKEIGFRLLAEGKSVRIKAEGFSMYPSIKPGSVIFIEPYGKDVSPFPGEIIAWKKESGFVVHRLARCYEKDAISYFVTRGDSSMSEDEPVLSGNIAGKVVRIEYPEGNPVQESHYLNKNPKYSFNRFKVWIILQFSRVKRVFTH
jgi:signal peptidase I